MTEIKPGNGKPDVILLNGPSSAGKSSIAKALQDGKTVIIDHVITSARIYGALSHAVAGFQMKTVLVRCDVETLRRREAERGDRCVGSAEVSAQFLYPKTEYDLCIDSSNKSPAALAEEIVRSLT